MIDYNPIGTRSDAQPSQPVDDATWQGTVEGDRARAAEKAREEESDGAARPRAGEAHAGAPGEAPAHRRPEACRKACVAVDTLVTLLEARATGEAKPATTAVKDAKARTRAASKAVAA